MTTAAIHVDHEAHEQDPECCSGDDEQIIRVRIEKNIS
jgi:hypothetical protein